MSEQLNHIYFVDRNLGKLFPKILTEGGLHVERHHDLFPQDGPDEQWIEYCGCNSRVGITRDRRIRYAPSEFEAIKCYNTIVLVVVGKFPYADLARNFVSTLPKIEAMLKNNNPPLIAKVYYPTQKERELNPLAVGSVKLWWP